MRRGTPERRGVQIEVAIASLRADSCPFGNALHGRILDE
jgi:hypothetical protein